jgi:hypothetical protein
MNDSLCENPFLHRVTESGLQLLGILFMLMFQVDE